MDRLHEFSLTEYPSKVCPICKEKEETNGHVQQCKNFASRKTQMKMLEKPRTWFSRQSAHPILSVEIKKYNHFWMRGRECTSADKLNKHSQIHVVIVWVVEEQNLIGWDHAIRGRLSKK